MSIIDSARKATGRENDKTIRRSLVRQMIEEKVSSTPTRSGADAPVSDNVTRANQYATDTSNAYSNIKSGINNKTTIASNLTDEERKKRIKDIETEIHNLNISIDGNARAKSYTGHRYQTQLEQKIAEYEARKKELAEELKSLQRVGEFSAEEMLQFEIEDAKAEKAKLPNYNPTARIAPAQVDTFVENAKAHSAADKKIDTLKRKKDLYEKVAKFGDVVNEDTFTGQTKANYRSADLSRDADKAMQAYLLNPTEENREIAYAYDAFARAYAKNNENALDDENVEWSWLSKSAAGYMPQFLDQAIPQAIGLGVGTLFGGSVGGAIGAGLATTAQSQGVMRGAVYRELLAAGVDAETAEKAATDEALISSIIEGGETAIGWLLAGGGKALSAIGNAATKSVAKGSTNAATKLIANTASKWLNHSAKKAAKAATAPLWKTTLSTAGGIVGNALSEYGEEASQEAVSIANQRRVLEGNANDGLISSAWDVAKDAVSGRDKVARAQMHEAGKEGAKIGLMFGGSNAVVNNTIAHIANNNEKVAHFFNAKTIEEQNADLDFMRNDKETLDALIEQGKASGAGTVSAKIAEEIEATREKGEEITREQVKKLIVANDVYIKNEEKLGIGESAKIEAEERAKQANARQTQDVSVGTPILHRVEALTKNGEKITTEEAKAASGYGDYGAKVLTDFVNNVKGQTFSQVKSDMHLAYLAGLVNKDMKPTTDLQREAYFAGKQDRSMSKVVAQENIASNKVFEKGGLITPDTYKGTVNGMKPISIPDSVSPAMAKAYGMVGEHFGRKVIFVDNLYAYNEKGEIVGEADAQVDSQGVFAVSANADKPHYKLIAHEPLHIMRQENTGAYHTFIDFALQNAELLDIRLEQGDSVGTTYDSLQRVYTSKGLSLEFEKTIDEIGARFSEKLFQNDQEAIDFINKMNEREDTRNALQKFMDAVKRVIAKLKEVVISLKKDGEHSAAKEVENTIFDLERARELYAKAYKATQKAVENRVTEQKVETTKVQKSTGAEDGGKSFSLKENMNLNNGENSDIVNDESEFDSVLKTMLSNVKISRVKMKNFPPYDKSKSDTNELSTRWAHREKVKTGAQAIVFHKNRCYIIEKFDDADLKYIIKGRINYQDYQNIRKELEENARTEEGKSAAELVVIYDQRDRQGNLNERRRQGIDGSAVEHRRKDDGIQRVDKDQNHKRDTEDDFGGSDEQNSGNRENLSLTERNYSLKDDVEVSPKKTKELLDTIAYLKDQMKLTKFAKPDPKKLKTMTRKLLKDYGSKIDLDETTAALEDLYRLIEDAGKGNPDSWNDVFQQTVFRQAREIAGNIVENAVTVDNRDWETYKELREYLRNTKIYINPKAVKDAEAVRRRNFGRIGITTKDNNAQGIDEAFQELAVLYPEFFDEERAGAGTDKLRIMEEVLVSLRPLEFNPFAGKMDEAVTAIAGELIQTFIPNVPKAKPTFADRMKSRAQAAIEQERALVEKRVEERTVSLKKETDRMRESQKAKVLRAKITRCAGQLNRRLVKPTDNRHIPKELQEAVGALLYNINLESAYTYDPKTGGYTKSASGLPTDKTEAFQDLKKVYAEIAEKNEYGLVLAPELIGSEDAEVGNIFDEVMELSKKKIADMTSMELEKIYQAICIVEHSVKTAGDTLALVDWANLQETFEALQKSTTTRKRIHAIGDTRKTLDIETPLTFFSHLGEAGDKLYRSLRNAQDNEQRMQDEFADVAGKITSREYVDSTKKERYTFQTAGGKELTLSKSHIMSIYLLSKSKKGLRHLLHDEEKGYFGYGIHQPKIDWQVKDKLHTIHRADVPTELTQTDLDHMFAKLTKEDKEVCRKLQEATNILAKWGNKACMSVFGYEKFLAPDYWLAKVAPEGVGKTKPPKGSEKKPRKLKNMGSAKNTDVMANAALDIDDVFSTFSQHASDMIRYSAWLGIMEDMDRLYRYKLVRGSRDTGEGFESMLNKYAGAGGASYFTRLMEDIQNGRGASYDTETEKLWAKIYGKVQGAAVAHNLRVVIQQPTSIARAANVLDPVSIVGAIGEGVAIKPTLDGWKKAVKYAPIASRKAIGGYEIGANAKGLVDEFFKPVTKKGKAKDLVAESGFALAGKADELTWGVIWNACEIETNKKKSLEKGSAEYYKAVAELFTEVIDETQVVDGVLQRNQVMRSSSSTVKQMTAFLGEPTQAINGVIRAYDQLVHESNLAKRGKAIKKFGRAVAVYAVTSAFTGFAASLVDGLRDDDEEEKYWGKVRKHFIENSVDNVNPLNAIPLVKDLMSIFSGYNVERMDAAVVSDVFKSAGDFMETLSGENKKTIGYATMETLTKGAKVFGKSPYNIMRDVEGIIRTVLSGSPKERYKFEKMRTKPNANTSAYIDILYKAYMTDKKDYEYIYNDLIKNGVRADKIKIQMETRMKKAEGVKETTELSKRYMEPSAERAYDKSLSQVKSSKAWKSANDEQKKNAEGKLYDFLTSTSEAMELARAEARAKGVDETEYTLWQLAKEIVNDEKESLNAIEKAQAIEMLSLGESELAYFYNTETAEKAYAYGVSIENLAKFKAAVSGLKGDTKKSKILAYANQYASNNKEWLFFMGSEYSSYKKRSDYISYFGK